VDLPWWRAAASARCASLPRAPHTTQTHGNRQTEKKCAWGRPRLLFLKRPVLVSNSEALIRLSNSDVSVRLWQRLLEKILGRIKNSVLVSPKQIATKKNAPGNFCFHVLVFGEVLWVSQPRTALKVGTLSRCLGPRFDYELLARNILNHGWWVPVTHASLLRAFAHAQNGGWCPHQKLAVLGFRWAPPDNDWSCFLRCSTPTLRRRLILSADFERCVFPIFR